MNKCIRNQFRVRWGGIRVFAILALVYALVVVPVQQWNGDQLFAQQQTVSVPSPAALAAMAVTVNTNLTTTPLIATYYNGNNTTTQAQVTGAHNIYGFTATTTGVGGQNCFVQVFDMYPAASITVGTTVPKYSYPITAFATTTLNAVTAYVSPLPLVNLTSSLGYAAATTAAGNTACVGTVNVSVHFR